MSTLGCTSAEWVAGGPEPPGTPEFCISTERRVCHPPPQALPPGPALCSELLPGQGGGRGPQGPKAWAAVWSTHRQGDSCRRGEQRPEVPGASARTLFPWVRQEGAAWRD